MIGRTRGACDGYNLNVRILALDTTTRSGSVALWDGRLIEERTGDPGKSHAERLPGDLVDLLTAHGWRVGDVERYAVASGPGSFTGMRVGIATIQGLALVQNRLVAPISALEALAHEAARRPEAEPGAFVAGWMDAYRGEVFGALYRVAAAAPPADEGLRPRGSATLELVDDASVGAPAVLADRWRARLGGARLIIAGDGVGRTRSLLDERFGPLLVAIEPAAIAGTLAALAAADPARAVRPHAIVPLYVRRPDAELARDRAQVPAAPS